MKERFDLLGVLFENHLGSFLILLLKLRKRVKFCSQLELFRLDAIEIKENFVLLQGSKLRVPKTKIPLKQLNVMLTVKLVDLL